MRRIWNHSVFFLCVALIATRLCAQTAVRLGSADSTFPPAAAATPERSSEPGGDSALRLGNGDLLEVSVYNVPELSTKTRVGSAGDIYLPLIDYIHVAGLTINEAEAAIEKRLDQGGFVKNPHVHLFVDEYTSAGVSVLGEVTRPGVYPVLGDQRLFDVISAAGGFTDKAGKDITVTHRGQAPVALPISRNIAEHSDSNIAIAPGDTINVSQADIIYVVGDVLRPSGFLMQSGHLSVLQAIALAGGANSTAKLSGARIVHKGPSGLSETPVPLKKLLQAKADDIELQPDDILFVPTSARKLLAGRTAEAALQMATGVALITVR
jgi:polysaccharide export outer membrane protein